MSRNLFEYRVAIHVHSRFSDGSGEIPDILEAGAAAGLDAVILTDHNTLRAKEEGWEGWHDDLLLIVGEEVTSRSGHCLAVGTERSIWRKQSTDGVFRDIDAQNGVSFIAHPHGVYRPLIRNRDHSWQDWSVNGYTGLELWSYMFDWVRDLKYYRFFHHYNRPHEKIRGPLSATVEAWDRLCLKHRVVAIGGVDAHARRIPLSSMIVFPYEDLFRTVRTHVLLDEPLEHLSEEDIPRMVQALREGHCFISWDEWQDAAGTRFGSADGAVMGGDEAPFHGPIELEISLPDAARIRVIRNGSEFLVANDRTLCFRADRPGAYRAEAHLDGRPWIFTNPIYLRDVN